MSRGMVVAIAIVLAVFVALPILSKVFAPHENAAATSTETREIAPVIETPVPASASRPGTRTAFPIPGGNQVSAWNAQSLIGTQWQVDKYTFALGPKGQVSVGGVIPGVSLSGTWTVSGNTLTISGMGQSYQAQVRGNQILAGGKPARRIKQGQSPIILRK
ncbi:MAG: hypothetical protein HY706_01450 [Candidatus Hydrogenedentes bacterium]|nr:hypothetical protein [Candidatus Hydrogenedentota bacterium]